MSYRICKRPLGHDGPCVLKEFKMEMCLASNRYSSSGRPVIVCTLQQRHDGSHDFAILPMEHVTKFDSLKQCTVIPPNNAYSRCELQDGHNGEHSYRSPRCGMREKFGDKRCFLMHGHQGEHQFLPVNCSCGKPMGPDSGDLDATSHVCAKPGAVADRFVIESFEAGKSHLSEPCDSATAEQLLASYPDSAWPDHPRRPKLYKLVEVEYEVATKVVIKETVK